MTVELLITDPYGNAWQIANHKEVRAVILSSFRCVCRACLIGRRKQIRQHLCRHSLGHGRRCHAVPIYAIVYYMEYTTRNRIGSRIKARRRAKGLTALELARRVGITENAIRKLESGDSKEPRLSTALLLADALDVDPDFVYGRRPKSRAGRIVP